MDNRFASRTHYLRILRPNYPGAGPQSVQQAWLPGAKITTSGYVPANLSYRKYHAPNQTSGGQMNSLLGRQECFFVNFSTKTTDTIWKKVTNSLPVTILPK